MSVPYEFVSQAGVRRDGTELDSSFYNEGVWVRWQRGKPRKIGGYRAMSQLANGPVRSLLVDSRNGTNSAHYFSPWGVQRQQFSAQGAGGGLEDRTPISFTPDQKLTWSQAIMTSSTGADYSALLACATPDVDQIDSDVVGQLYQGDMANSSLLAPVSSASGPIQVSGGVTVLQPFCFVYGSNGLIKNSNPNDFSNSGTLGWTVGGGSLANEANVAGTKFIYGAPVRGGGQSPAGLFWALDALVRVSFNAGSTAFPWNYDTLAQPTSILAKKGVVEHDGKFFWPGMDRFLFYNGVVQELPNQMNSNWFFDNLNYAARNKVWGTKIGRYGEIWWFYPRGTATECDSAVIFNYLENTWYDASKVRSAGGQVQQFQYPVWAGSEDGSQTIVLTVGFRVANSAQTASGNNVLTFASTAGVVDGMVVTAGVGVPAGTTVVSHTGTTTTISANTTAIVPTGTPITFSSMTSPFLPGDTVTGATTGATGTVVRATQTALNLRSPTTGTFNSSEILNGPHSAVAVSKAAPYAQQLDAAYQHEFGYNKIIGQEISAIRSSFTSKSFGFAVGDPFMEAMATKDIMTDMQRLDPDFKQVGDLEVTVSGRSFTRDPFRDLETKTCRADDPFVSFNCQERELRLKIESNVRDGNFEQGQAYLQLDAGDERSSAEMPGA